jgi:hypothetical protein
VFESRLLRRIFEPKKEEVIGELRISNNEKLHKYQEGFLVLGSNGKNILGPREEKSWTTLFYINAY